MEIELFALGTPTRSDAEITTMSSKDNTLVPGDLVKVSELSSGTDPKGIEVEKASASTDCIYGVVTFGGFGKNVPVVVKGHVIAHIDSSIFSSLEVGNCLEKNCILLVKKVDALKVDGSKESSAYEVKL